MVGVQLDEGVVIGEGNQIAISIKDRLRETVLDEYKVDNENRLTFVLDIPKNRFAVGQAVFLMDKEASYSEECRYDDQSAGPFTTPDERNDSDPTSDSSDAE